MTLVMTKTIYFINSIDINHEKKVCSMFIYSLFFDFHRRQNHLLMWYEHQIKKLNRLEFLSEKLLPALMVRNLNAGWPLAN